LSIDITEADKVDQATPNEADPLADKGTNNRRTVLHGLTWVSLLCALNFFTSKVFFSFFVIWTPVTSFNTSITAYTYTIVCSTTVGRIGGV